MYSVSIMRPLAPLLTVHELHGTTPKRLIDRLLVPPHLAMPGDIVATRETGPLDEEGVFYGGFRFVRMEPTGGFADYRLSDLPPLLQEPAALCQAAIDDDVEIYEELDMHEPYLCELRPEERHLEVFRFHNALGMLRLPEARALRAPAAPDLAALFVEAPKEGQPALPRPHHQALSHLWACLQGHS